MATARIFLIGTMIIGLIFFVDNLWTRPKAESWSTSVKSPKKTTKIIMTRASISKYVATGNRMANGKEYPYDGCAATSDYSIPLGSLVLVDGKIYVIKDRTARWIQIVFGLTIDLYSDESVEDCLRFGRRWRPVIIKIQN